MFGGGGGGLNPRKMKQMMEQMGIDVDEIETQEVIIRTEDADLVFEDADVTKMDARGQETYQVVGSPEEREPGSAGGAESASGGEAESDDSGAGVPDDDVEIVAMRTGASEEAAREALEENDGDLAAAVDQLE